MRKRLFYAIVPAALILPFPMGAMAQMASDSYRITTTVLSGGGAPISSVGYQSNATLGQSSPLMDTSDPPHSTSYDNYPGFWYTVDATPPDFCQGDFDTDHDVDSSDLATFAADFGRTDCGGGLPCEGDFDNDKDVDGSDLATFAADFGRTDCLE